MSEWKSIDTAPKNGTHFEAELRNGGITDCHFAEDLTGEEQPPFSGFFAPVLDCDTKKVISFRAVNPIKWRPK